MQVNRGKGGKVFTNTKLHSTHPLLAVTAVRPMDGRCWTAEVLPIVIRRWQGYADGRNPCACTKYLNPYLYYAEFM